MRGVTGGLGIGIDEVAIHLEGVPYTRLHIAVRANWGAAALFMAPGYVVGFCFECQAWEIAPQIYREPTCAIFVADFCRRRGSLVFV